MLLLIFLSYSLNAQEIVKKDSLSIDKKENLKFKYKQLIIPTVLVGYGVIGLSSNGLKNLNVDIRDGIIKDNHSKITIDNFSQYAPAVSVYALNLCGIKGKNNLFRR